MHMGGVAYVGVAHIMYIHVRTVQCYTINARMMAKRSYVSSHKEWKLKRWKLVHESHNPLVAILSYLVISLLHVGVLHLECDLYSSEFGNKILCSTGMFKGCDLCSSATYTPAKTGKYKMLPLNGFHVCKHIGFCTSVLHFFIMHVARTLNLHV